MTPSVERKFWACYKRAGEPTPVTLGIRAPDVGAALDKMYDQVGRTATDLDDEYDLMEIVGPAENQYVPVAQKFKNRSPATPKIDKKQVEERVYAEKLYVTWRQAA